MTLRTDAPWLFLLCLLSACSPKDETPTAPSPAAATPSISLTQRQTLAAVPEEERRALEAFARQLETDLREGDTNAVRGAFDPVGMAEAVTAGMQAPQAKLDQFRQGMQQGLLTSLGQLAGQFVGQEPRYKGLVLFQGEPAARFRLVSDTSGITFLDLILRKNNRGRLSIVDYYNHAVGLGMVEQARQTAVMILADLDRSFLERLVNKPGVRSEDLKRFAELATKTRTGDPSGAVAAYRALPASLQETLAATSLYLTALQQSEDDAGYKAALSAAAKRFNSASFQFMLVDLYTLEKDYDQALDCVEAFANVVGRDATLLTLKGVLLQARGDVGPARASQLEALALEPDCRYVHVHGLDILLAARDFAVVRRSLLFLEASGEYDFKGALTDPVWDDFKQAPESEGWR